MALLHKGQVAFAADKRACTRVSVPARVCTRVVTSSQGRVRTSTVCQAVQLQATTKKDLLNKSYYPTSADTSNSTKRWYVIDASGQTLGRLACLAATYIRGKHLPTYTPSMDMGAFVIVINAEKIEVSGKKYDDKLYFNQRETGRPGSHKLEKYKDLHARLPERIIERAVKGMLPKGRLGRDIRLHLKVFKGPAHTHEAQQPTDITNEVSIKPKEGAGAKLLAELRAKAGK